MNLIRNQREVKVVELRAAAGNGSLLVWSRHDGGRLWERFGQRRWPATFNVKNVKNVIHDVNVKGQDVSLGQNGFILKIFNLTSSTKLPASRVYLNLRRVSNRHKLLQNIEKILTFAYNRPLPVAADSQPASSERLCQINLQSTLNGTKYFLVVTLSKTCYLVTANRPNNKLSEY